MYQSGREESSQALQKARCLDDINISDLSKCSSACFVKTLDNLFSLEEGPLNKLNFLRKIADSEPQPAHKRIEDYLCANLSTNRYFSNLTDISWLKDEVDMCRTEFTNKANTYEKSLKLAAGEEMQSAGTAERPRTCSFDSRKPPLDPELRAAMDYLGSAGQGGAMSWADQQQPPLHPGGSVSAANQQRYWEEQLNSPGSGGRGSGGPGFS